ncbi:MAG: deoxyribonuclease IV [Calditrichia bacterium]
MKKEKKRKQSPPLGAHTSIAGGVQNAIYTGYDIGCDVVQIFSKNQMQWNGKPLTAADISAFKQAIEETGVRPITIHDAYLINLASPDPVTFRRSYLAFIDELIRCESLGVPYLVMHPGSHMGEGEEAGLDRIAKSIRQGYEQAEVSNTVLLLETTAGQGTNLGYRFEQIRYMMDRSGLGDKIAVCVDTCHIFAAGYDIRTRKAWQNTKAEFDRIIGLEKLKALHLNDSKRELGSRVDRHSRIGTGNIGLGGFRAILNDGDLQTIPMILEIPGGNSAYQQDLITLRKLIRSKNTA